MLTKSQKLSLLDEKVKSCTKCKDLVESRTQTVFGDGNPEADVLILSEAPGKDEDEQGIPFVGRAGKLLDNIIEACGWKREDVYICNILKCRPPGNRNPNEDEAENCRAFLDLQIKIVNPKYIVCLGAVAAQNLLNIESPIGRMRGQWHTYNTAKVLCTYHPAYLLRNPAAKKSVWEDLQILLKEMKGQDEGS